MHLRAQSKGTDLTLFTPVCVDLSNCGSYKLDEKISCAMYPVADEINGTGQNVLVNKRISAQLVFMARAPRSFIKYRKSSKKKELTIF